MNEVQNLAKKFINIMDNNNSFNNNPYLYIMIFLK